MYLWQIDSRVLEIDLSDLINIPRSLPVRDIPRNYGRFENNERNFC